MRPGRQGCGRRCCRLRRRGPERAGREGRVPRAGPPRRWRLRVAPARPPAPAPPCSAGALARRVGSAGDETGPALPSPSAACPACVPENWAIGTRTNNAGVKGKAELQRERTPAPGGPLRGLFSTWGKKQKHAGLGSRQPRSSSLSEAGPPGARPPPHLATWAQPGPSLCLRPGSPSKHGTPGAPPGRGRRGRGLPPAPARPGAVFQVPIRIRASLLRLAVC